MSLSTHVSKTQAGDMKFVVVVTGTQDVYRFASHMLTGQVEFAREGSHALQTLRRRIPAYQWNYMLSALAGPATRRFKAKREATQ